MKSGLEWYKRYPVAYLGGVQGLTSKEHAVYSIVLDLIYQHGGVLNNDPSWIAGWIKDMGSSSVRHTLKSLINKGKLSEIDGKITQKRAETEVKLKRNRSETNKKNGRFGGGFSPKSKATSSKNNDLAEASRVEYSRVYNKEDKEKKSSPSKGSRISEDWNPTIELVEAIAEKEQTSSEWVNSQVYKFVNHFASQSGAKGVKLKWDLTFRNWCNNSFDEKPSRITNGSAEKWEIRLIGFINNNLWHESFGPEPTTDGKPDGPLNPECGAGIEKLREIFKRGPLI